MSPPAPNKLSAPLFLRTQRKLAVFKPSPPAMPPGLSKAFAWGIDARLAAMNPVLSSCFRNGSKLDVAPLGTSVEELICASEQSAFVGSAANVPNTLKYRSGSGCPFAPIGAFGEPSALTVA